MISPPPRSINRKYDDPISIIWVHCLESLGWRLERSAEVFASWDGCGVLTLGVPSDLDLDDHLGQLILHELCHALIEGLESHNQLDWGLENFDSRHLVNELACHRLQVYLADRVNLRSFFAVTTDWRPYYDAIPEDALQRQNDQALTHWSSSFGLALSEASRLDREAIQRAERALANEAHSHIIDAINLAIRRTEAISHIVSELCSSHSLWSIDSRASIPDGT